METNLNSNRLLRCLTALCCEPWLIEPEMHKTLTDIVTAHASGGEQEQQQHELAAGMMPMMQKKKYQMAGNTALIPVEGVIGRKFSNMLYDSGVTSIDIFTRLLTTAAMDEDVSSIVLSFDSPGGTAVGVPEVAEEIRRAATEKPVFAFVDGRCCSAAYWMAAQCDAIYSLGSADVGSIGCYMALLDSSRMAEMQGLKMKLFASGKFKGMGMPGTALTETQEKMIQDRVMKIADDFKQSVVKGRARSISPDVMQGQTFSTDEALANGLIDCVSTLERCIQDAETKSNMKRR